MRNLVFGILFCLPTTSSWACSFFLAAPLDLGYIKHADVVLTGQISNYKRVQRDEYGAFRRHGRFDINVDEVLIGTAPSRISVTLRNSSYGLPAELPDGRFLIALRSRRPGMPPLYSDDVPYPEVLQKPCSSPFMLKIESDEARAVRQMLINRRN